MKFTLRAVRTNLGLTRKDAAKLFGIHFVKLASYEADSSDIPMSFFSRIEKIYGVPLEQIYFGKEDEHYLHLKEKNQEELEHV